jgi:hypothetical protein
MTRKLTPNRWNWSQKDEQWVYIELLQNGHERYFYQTEPPHQFIDLVMKIKDLNEKLILTKDPRENEKIFNKMIKISKKMQSMEKK